MQSKIYEGKYAQMYSKIQVGLTSPRAFRIIVESRREMGRETQRDYGKGPFNVRTDDSTISMVTLVASIST